MPAVSERVYRIQPPFDGNAVHLYLVRGAKLALIDSGAGDSPEAAIEPALRGLGLGWSDLDYLLNTHGHADHAGGNGELKAAAPQVQIAIHPRVVHTPGHTAGSVCYFWESSSTLFSGDAVQGHGWRAGRRSITMSSMWSRYSASLKQTCKPCAWVTHSAGPVC
jgi:glyoxylase-like metal-dependent hydrolase (beta-lactamase superfamily II)